MTHLLEEAFRFGIFLTSLLSALDFDIFNLFDRSFHIINFVPETEILCVVLKSNLGVMVLLKSLVGWTPFPKQPADHPHDTSDVEMSTLFVIRVVHSFHAAASLAELIK